MRRATERINGEGYRELIKLLQSLRGLTVTKEICLKIFEGVRSERSLVNLDVSELRISVADDAIPVELAVARQDFEDMLRNPIRNAIQASHKMDVHGEVVIGLSIGRMLDPITGESWTEFAIKDRCTTMISDTLIHQRSIESGLGLMASLVSKYDGSVRVEAQPAPWTKAVVISLPCPENQQETWTV